MNIVYLIGNGFDLKLELKTRYSDFYKECYQIADGDSEAVKSIKTNISREYKNWADLEKGLGEYSLKVNNEQEYIEAFNDIRTKLVEYISTQNINRTLSNLERDEYIKTFREPYIYLAVGEINEFSTFINIRNRNTSGDNINFITFNYTNSLEQLLNYSNKQIVINTGNIRPITINNIYHIHGYPTGRFVLGVDNENQILNEKFRSERLLRKVVKPLNNKKVAGGNVGIICLTFVLFLKITIFLE